MSTHNFERESKNPRLRRAFARTLIDKAIKTGTPEDKLVAAEAAAAASVTAKGKELGHQALAAFRRTTGQELLPTQARHNIHTHTTFTNETNARAIKVVSDITGTELGVSVRIDQPEDKEGYEVALRRADYSRVKRSAGTTIKMPTYNGGYKTVAADIPKTTIEVQSLAGYHLTEASKVIDFVATQDTDNFFNTVDAITTPHASTQAHK